jgi:hypothetical protein
MSQLLRHFINKLIINDLCSYFLNKNVRNRTGLFGCGHLEGLNNTFLERVTALNFTMIS